MGYPYSYQNNNNAGIYGPVPPSLDSNTVAREFDLYGKSDSEIFYSGFTKSEYKSLIRASLQRILMTNPGERVMVPEFGCDLRKYCFEPGDTILEVELKHEILKAIQTWEPRVTVNEISIKRTEDHRVLIVVPYKINGTDISDTLNYSLKERG